MLECKRYFSPFLLIACWVCSEFTWHLSIVYLYSASQRDVSDFKSFCLVSVSVLRNAKHVMPSYNVCCMLCLVFCSSYFLFFTISRYVRSVKCVILWKNLKACTVIFIVALKVNWYKYIKNIKRNIRRTRGNCTFQHQIWKKNLVYDFSNLLV